MELFQRTPVWVNMDSAVLMGVSAGYGGSGAASGCEANGCSWRRHHWPGDESVMDVPPHSNTTDTALLLNSCGFSWPEDSPLMLGFGQSFRKLPNFLKCLLVFSSFWRECWLTVVSPCRSRPYLFTDFTDSWSGSSTASHGHRTVLRMSLHLQSSEFSRNGRHPIDYCNICMRGSFLIISMRKFWECVKELFQGIWGRCGKYNSEKNGLSFDIFKS